MKARSQNTMVKDEKELMEMWDFERNSAIGLDPKEETVNSNELAYWECKNGHGWQEKIKTVYRRKNKCFYCSRRLVVAGENDLQTLHPEIAAEWDYEKNSITPNKVSPRDTKKYWWRCKNGHPSFQRSVSHRVSRHDKCPYCSGRRAISGFNDLATLYPEIAKEWDFEGNEGVTPDQVPADTWKSYKWICPKGHHYRMKVHSRTHSEKKIDCPKCVKAHSTSFFEQAVFYYASQFYPDAINRYKGWSDSGLELDIYLPRWKIGIEYDGAAFHGSKEAWERDRRKYELCQERDIRLIRIKEKDEQRNSPYREANMVFYVKKRMNDTEISNHLIFFFTQLTTLSHSHYVVGLDPATNRKVMKFRLPVDINIRRDRPKILSYLIDVEHSFGAIYPELARNWDEDSNGNLTPFMLTPGSNHKAFFKCEECGKVWDAPITVVVKWKRTLCKKCAMRIMGKGLTAHYTEANGSLADFSKELAEQWDKEANGDLTPSDIPANYSKKVSWQCPICHYKWEASPNSRIRKNGFSGCPHCAGRVAMAGVDDLETLYPEIAREWDYEKNGNTLPSHLRPHSSEKRYWICSKHNVGYFTSPSNRINHEGCPICKRERISASKGFRVEQYSKELKHIKTYLSLGEAARALDTSPETIRQAAINGVFSLNSYWKYEGKEFGALKPDKKSTVTAIDPKTGKTTRYDSAREAERKTGINHTDILNCCKGKKKPKLAGGYYWKFSG